MPGNRAVAYGKHFEYSLIQVKSVSEDSLAIVNDKIIIASDLIETFVSETKVIDFELVSKISLKDFEGLVLRHPLYELGYDFEVPLLEADFVTTEQGTGFVHIAPGHGSDDFDLGVKNSLPVIETVEDDGYLKNNLPLFGGMHVLRDNEKIADLMVEHKALIGRGSLVHSYPHSWRSKAPLIFRTTPQWFISMEKNDLRKLALKGINDTKFFPDQGANRLYSMIKG
jgi:Isoleucyl-tRNA synthetase